MCLLVPTHRGSPGRKGCSMVVCACVLIFSFIHSVGYTVDLGHVHAYNKLVW